MGMKKILIVDYDQNSLTSLQAVFAGQGYQVVTAADGQTGWDKYNKESPDLVLMEAMLPKVHGFELCQRITSERNSQATVFIMTGVYKDRVYRTEALRTYGASEYFEKPLKMAELVSSVEAVLGKPEPKPAEARLAAEPPAASVRGPHPGGAPAEPRKREKPRSDDSIFSLPDDLDRLSREMPKARKPAPAHREPSEEARFESLADDLLKTVIVEATTPKTVQPRPAGGNGNGNGNGNGAEIDQFLKSALAGLELEKEKIKVPKTAPLPPPPPPAKAAPVPPPPVAAAAEPKPAPPQPPRPDSLFTPAAEKDMKSILTPGDPGSDVSPFFTPEKPKPEATFERPKYHPASVPPAVRQKPARPFQPAEKAENTAAAEPVRREPFRPEPVKPAPVPQEKRDREAEAIASTGIFDDVAETRDQKGFPKLVVVAVIVAVAAVGFILLRPKSKAPSAESLQPAEQTAVQTNVPAEPVEEVPPPEVKPAPAKPKPQAKTADPGPAGADAILPTGAPAAPAPLVGTQPGPGGADARTAAASNPAQADPPPANVEEVPPAGTPQNTAVDTGAAAVTETSIPVSKPAAPPVNEGDLIELSAVTEPPALIKRVEPVYPQTAQRLGIGGSITVNALVNEKGNVIDTAILKGIQDDMGLGRAAQNAVKKWKFQPARKDGVAVKVWKSVVISFKADANPADQKV